MTNILTGSPWLPHKSDALCPTLEFTGTCSWWSHTFPVSHPWGCSVQWNQGKSIDTYRWWLYEKERYPHVLERNSVKLVRYTHYPTLGKKKSSNQLCSCNLLISWQYLLSLSKPNSLCSDLQECNGKPQVISWVEKQQDGPHLRQYLAGLSVETKAKTHLR